ncbi:hypothetical protein B4U84_09160 [Westiellopsis prolifica IICB1]|nr:hypothetical protein B4U84_09160 [Westiellopsis prolifica IICB1]
MSEELNQDDLETLVDLLLISSKVKTREALCIRLGISYYRQLGFINDLSEESFAINLINHLYEVGNTKAICQLCCKELEPIFKGGQRESILKEIVVKLNCTQDNKNDFQNSDQAQQDFNPPKVSRKFGTVITQFGKKERFGAIVIALISSFIGIFIYKNLGTTQLSSSDDRNQQEVTQPVKPTLPQDKNQLIELAWSSLIKVEETKNIDDANKGIEYTNECIDRFQQDADNIQAKLKEQNEPIPPVGIVSKEENQIINGRGALNDTATCLWIQGELYRLTDQTSKARDAYNKVTKYTYARTWDLQGWFWSPANEAKKYL